MADLPAPAHAQRLVGWALQDHGIYPLEVAAHGADRDGNVAEAWAAHHLALSVRFTVAGRPVEYSQEIARQAAEVLTGMGAGQVEVKLASSSARMSTYSYAVTAEVHAELDYRPCPPGDRVPPIPMGRPAKPPRSERKAVRCSECGEVIDNAMGSNVRTHTICAKLVEQHARSQSPELAPGGADCPAGELAEVPG